MSRSYKKSPWCNDHSRGMKRIANHKIRHGRNAEDIPNGKAYRKYFCTYDICDYKFYRPYSEYLRDEEAEIKRNINCGFPNNTCGAGENYWKKWYRRK